MKKAFLTLSAVFSLSAPNNYYSLHNQSAKQVSVQKPKSTSMEGVYDLSRYIHQKPLSKTKEQNKHDKHYYSVNLDKNLQTYIISLCKKEDIEPRLAFAVVETESHGDPNVVSTSGDYGLFQVNAWYQRNLISKMGISNLLDPYENSKIGVYMLSHLVHKYNNVTMALLGYHEGIGGMQQTISEGIWSTSYTQSVYKNLNEIKIV